MELHINEISKSESEGITKKRYISSKIVERDYPMIPKKILKENYINLLKEKEEKTLFIAIKLLYMLTEGKFPKEYINPIKELIYNKDMIEYIAKNYKNYSRLLWKLLYYVSFDRGELNFFEVKLVESFMDILELGKYELVDGEYEIDKSKIGGIIKKYNNALLEVLTKNK